MVLTKGDKMLLTPTYHVFEMYKVHHGAINLPLEIATGTREIRNRAVPAISASASKKGDVINITLANMDLEKGQEITINLSDDKEIKPLVVNGRILTSKNITDYNTFENPGLVKPQVFTDAKISKGQLTVKMPAKSIITLEIKRQ
ncbi:alpha-L-arabinofuranosidase C-terminal domain-containing protein [Viscerimonas tarda]